ncbi:Phosphoglucomutase [Candidatus Ornithobacterium hominis]|uniref:phospho-sugar mutase n=1 Tax=Candidatus Ornithobacterium hominis TaxID=2497989 RepID=UPI0024BD1ED5|nr:phospho-sugar mutase [Candidatus Ornithobacterium hominis]CAI9429165.1 Phosphoglucomutase [Candidatus Ornithobacterium hominis]
MKIIDKAKVWLNPSYDAETREAVQQLIDSNPKELEDAFYKNLEFGTGGMRGIMGVGTNRLNKYTLGTATQGLANYLNEQFQGEEIKVAIAHDVRNNSRKFMQIVADVLSANNIHVYIFDGFRPTPELSFAVRHLGCNAGIVLTASHNPPAYNGYKVYWNDGAQVTPPHDEEIIRRVNQVKAEHIQFTAKPDLIHVLSNEIDQTFIEKCVQFGSRNDKKGYDDLKIVFTPIHGTAIASIPEALEEAGFKNVFLVEEQTKPSGEFPTVESPNPEEPAALKMAMELAELNQADIVIGTDPDADRLGVAVRNKKGEMVLLNGNQTNTVLTHFLLNELKEKGEINSKNFIGSTIVTSDIFIEMAEHFGVNCKTGLTGFKWIGKMIREAEENEKFVCGGEESFGFMVDDFVRDKDSVTSTLLACHIAAKAKNEGSSFYEELLKIYQKLTCYQEALVSLVRPGKSGADEIKTLMSDFRERTPETINGIKVVKLMDVQVGIAKNMLDDTAEKLTLPQSNVLIFYLEDGSKICVRPSGTEPKIKFYFSVKETLNSVEDYDETQAKLFQKLKGLEQSFK